jgi:hypothetical protein
MRSMILLKKSTNTATRWRANIEHTYNLRRAQHKLSSFFVSRNTDRIVLGMLLDLDYSNSSKHVSC